MSGAFPTYPSIELYLRAGTTLYTHMFERERERKIEKKQEFAVCEYFLNKWHTLQSYPTPSRAIVSHTIWQHERQFRTERFIYAVITLVLKRCGTGHCKISPKWNRHVVGYTYEQAWVKEVNHWEQREYSVLSKRVKEEKHWEQREYSNLES